MKASKIWLPKDEVFIHNNIYYYLLDGFNKEKGVKFEPLSWWTKNSTSDPYKKVYLGENCGVGKECISFNNKTAELSLEKINQIIVKNLGNKIFLIGGHYFPNPSNFSYVGGKTFSLFRYAINVLKRIQQTGKEVSLILFLNDIQLKNETRKQLYNNYVIPEIFRKSIISDDDIRKKIKVFIIGQKILCNTFVKEKQLFLKGNKIRTGDGLGTYWIDLEGELFRIMSTESFEDSGHMRCIQACTKILNVAQILKYDSVIQLYPVCGKKSVDMAELIAKKLYNYRLPTLDIYKTNSCFD